MKIIDMKKFLNRLLRDKDDFYKDDELKQWIDIHNYLLQEVFDMERIILPAKIRYFLKNKKRYLFRLIVQAIFILSIFGSVLFVSYFFGFRYDPPPSIPEQHQSILLYVNDDVDTAYIKKYLPQAQFVILYPESNTKDWDAYKELMHSRFESPGSDSASYFARRVETTKDGKKTMSQYWGRYQLGNSARKACGIGDMSWEEFSTNPEIQEGVFKTWIRLLYQDMAPYIAKYDGRFIAGHQITASGIVSMAHNVGTVPTIQFLRSRGDSIPADGNAPATRFLSLGGFDLTSILE